MRLLCFVLILSLPCLAKAEDAILIMDASRSMLGRVQGKRKVEIAREVVGKLLGEIPQERRLGFVAYGHRRADDCNDIEEVVPVGGDRTRIKSSLDAIEVKGQTPLTAAVRFAADKLGYTKNKATVVLVSDGIESCQADPCAAGKELEAAGIDLTVHVVGFGLKKGEAKQLKCLADETGGKYLTANNASELTRALEQTVAQPSKPVEGSATLAGPAAVVEGQKFEVSVTGPSNESDRISLARSDMKPTDWVTAIAPTSARDGKVALLAPSQPGTYELRYVHVTGTILAKASLEVTAGRAVLRAPATVGAGANFEVHWQGPDGEHDYVRLSDPNDEPTRSLDQRQVYRKNGVETLRAPTRPGKYELRYLIRAERIVARLPIEVLDATAELTAPAVVAVGSDFEVKWTGPSNVTDHVTLAQLESRASDNVAWSETHNKGGVTQLRAPLTPGKYELRYVMLSERILDRVTLAVTEVTATIHGPTSIEAGADFDVQWTGPNYRIDTIRVARAGSDDQSSVSWIDASKTGRAIRAPKQPGSYELRYVLGGRRVLARQPLLVH